MYYSSEVVVKCAPFCGALDVSHFSELPQSLSRIETSLKYYVFSSIKRRVLRAEVQKRPLNALVVAAPCKSAGGEAEWGCSGGCGEGCHVRSFFHCQLSSPQQIFAIFS